MTREEADAIAVWIGEVWGHLSPAQVKLFRELIEPHERETVIEAVKSYAKDYEYASLPGLSDRLELVIRKRANAAAANAARVLAERELDRLTDERIRGMSDADLREIRDGIYADAGNPAARALALRGDPRHSAAVRAHVRDTIREQLRHSGAAAERAAAQLFDGGGVKA